MKKLLLLVLCLLCCGAHAEGYNSFADDFLNAGRFDNIAWDGEYVYWLYTPDSLEWTSPPESLYRMKPGEGEAQLLLEGGSELYISGVRNTGVRLLLTVADDLYGDTRPAQINFDGSGYEELPGSIGGVVPGGDAVYNSADGGICKIPLDSMEAELIYSYPADILSQTPRITQFADGKLYFVTDAHDWYELDAESGRVRKFLHLRGDGFVLDGMFYIGDYDAQDGTWRYDLSTGERVQVSELVYGFWQGQGGFVRAVGAGSENWFEGAVFDFSKLEGSLEDVRVASCNANFEYIVDGRLLYHDRQNNRMLWREGSLAE